MPGRPRARRALYGSSGTVDVVPGVSGDDGYTTTGGGFSSGGGNLAIGHVIGEPTYETFVRFPNVTIPREATIQIAYLVVVETSTGPFTVKSNLYFEDADDAVAPTSRAEHVADVRTTAFTVWDDESFVKDADTQSPSIVDAIQEVTDRGSWVSGNALQLLWDDDGTAGTNFYRGATFDHATLDSVELHVEWST